MAMEPEFSFLDRCRFWDEPGSVAVEADGAGNGCRYPDEDLKRHSVVEETVYGDQVLSCVRVELPQKRARDLATLLYQYLKA